MDWTRARILEALEPVAPVAIDADVRAAALAEARVGAGRGRASIGYVSVGTGISAAFVLDGTQLRVTDFGTSLTEPDDYFAHVERFALFDTTSGALRAVPRAAYDDLRATIKTTQKNLYRQIAAMEHREKLNAGAYVYFSFMRPFAVVAGNAGDLSAMVSSAAGAGVGAAAAINADLVAEEAAAAVRARAQGAAAGTPRRG